MAEYAIKTYGVTKKYWRITALDQVSIHVPRGSIYGLVGDNGAGKSTLLKCIAGQAFPTSGVVEINGVTAESDLEKQRHQMGCMIEDVSFFPEMTVERQLEYYRIQRGITERNKVDEIIELVGLSAKRHDKCKKLSMGQRQRVGLAIALLADPQILVLDEPINGLDPTGVAHVRSLLTQLNEERGVTVLVSSHILAELQQIATDYGFISHGKLVEEISARSLHDKCSSYIEMRVSNLAKFTALLEKTYPKLKFIVEADKALRIDKSKAATVGDLSKLAAKHDLEVLELKTVEQTLEDYYLNLKKGVDRAQLY